MGWTFQEGTLEECLEDSRGSNPLGSICKSGFGKRQNQAMRDKPDNCLWMLKIVDFLCHNRNKQYFFFPHSTGSAGYLLGLSSHPAGKSSRGKYGLLLLAGSAVMHPWCSESFFHNTPNSRYRHNSGLQHPQKHHLSS